MEKKEIGSLLGLLLFLLADAYFEMLLLGFLESLVIMARHRVRQIGVYASVLRKDGHDCETLVARRAKRPKTFYIRDCHTESE